MFLGGLFDLDGFVGLYFFWKFSIFKICSMWRISFFKDLYFKEFVFKIGNFFFIVIYDWKRKIKIIRIFDYSYFIFNVYFGMVVVKFIVLIFD